MVMEGITTGIRTAASYAVSCVDPREYDLQRVAENVGRLAIPIVATLALSSLPGADAGPVAGTACCLALGLTAGPSVAACWWVWCMPGP